MTKPETYPVETPDAPRHTKHHDNPMPEPLSGSKKVKNQNHTGQRHGEGSWEFYCPMRNPRQNDR